MPLTDSDLVRLRDATGEAPGSLVEWLAPAEVDMTGEPSSFVELDAGRRLMVLAHRADGCRLLDGDRCRVWPARPLTCRLYPLDASFGRKGGIHRLRLFDAGVDCRYELDGAGSLGALRDAHATQRTELARYQARVAGWNRAQRQRQRLSRRRLSAAHFLAELTR